MTADDIDYQALLYGYAQYKREEQQALTDYLKTPFRMNADEASKVIKKHMEKEGLDELHEGEHGITGVLSYRGSGPFLSDWTRVPEAVIVAAARHGFLNLNVRLFREWHKKNDATWADDLEGLIQDGGKSSVLNLKYE